MTERPPSSSPEGSSVLTSFKAKDFYGNIISDSWGSDAFQAWSYTSVGNMTPATVRDEGNGSYRVESEALEYGGTTFFFVERNSLGIPGSPFEVTDKATYMHRFRSIRILEIGAKLVRFGLLRVQLWPRDLSLCRQIARFPNIAYFRIEVVLLFRCFSPFVSCTKRYARFLLVNPGAALRAAQCVLSVACCQPCLYSFTIPWSRSENLPAHGLNSCILPLY